MIHEYHTDVHKFHKFKYAFLESKKTPLIGVELEVSVSKNNPVPDVAKEVEKLLRHFCILARDGSVVRGFEIKTAASTYNYHLTAWNNFLEWHNEKKKLLTVHSSCGCHVTLEKAGWFISNEHIGRFTCFINATGTRWLIDKVAQRKENQYINYEKVGVESALSLNHCGHHNAVNTHKGGDKLIEVRIFQSVVEKQSILKNIEFVMAVVEYTKTATEYRSGKQFLAWLKDKTNSEKYPNLIGFLLKLAQEKKELMEASAKLAAAKALESEKIKIATAKALTAAKALESEKIKIAKIAQDAKAQLKLAKHDMLYKDWSKYNPHADNKDAWEQLRKRLENAIKIDTELRSKRKIE